MDETTFLRNLLKFRHVRKSDFHQPPTRKDRKKLLSDGTIDNNGGGITKRHPLSREERAEAEKTLASGALNGGAELGAAAEGPALSGGVEAEEGAGAGQEDLIAAEDFFKVFDALIDAKYPGDRGSATKVKVAFRKQHRSTVANLCLEDVEEIAQALQ